MLCGDCERGGGGRYQAFLKSVSVTETSVCLETRPYNRTLLKVSGTLSGFCGIWRMSIEFWLWQKIKER